MAPTSADSAGSQPGLVGEGGLALPPDPGPVGSARSLFNMTGAMLVLILVLLVGADILGRNLLGLPVAGVPEIVSMSIIVIVFLQAPKALIAGRWTQSDVLITALGRKTPRASRAVEDLFDLCGMALFAVISWGTWPLLVKAWTRSEFVGAMGDFTAPVWPMRLAVLAGSALLAVTFVQRIWRRHRTVTP